MEKLEQKRRFSVKKPKQYFLFKEAKTKKPILSRMYLINVKDRESYFIRLLLLHVKGVRSFKELRTVDNVLYDTFHEAAKARSLVKKDEEWDRYLQEACKIKFPYAICELFAMV